MLQRILNLQRTHIQQKKTPDKECLFDNKCRVSHNFLHYSRPPKNASETSLIVPKKKISRSCALSSERFTLSLSLKRGSERSLCVFCLCTASRRSERSNEQKKTTTTRANRRNREQRGNRRRERKAHRSGPLGNYPNLDTDGGNQFLTIGCVGTAGREERDGGVQ